MHHLAHADLVASPTARRRAWRPANHPPEPYELAVLSFADGTTCRGTWTGRMWWGYDARAGRSRELQPVAWLPWD